MINHDKPLGKKDWALVSTNPFARAPFCRCLRLSIVHCSTLWYNAALSKWCNNHISQPGCPLGPFLNEARWTWWWDWWQANHTPAMSCFRPILLEKVNNPWQWDGNKHNLSSGLRHSHASKCPKKTHRKEKKNDASLYIYIVFKCVFKIELSYIWLWICPTHCSHVVARLHSHLATPGSPGRVPGINISVNPVIPPVSTPSFDG